jgi:hypothetical protein
MASFMALTVLLLLSTKPLHSQNDALRIDDKGNVGIGTPTPSAPLQVNGMSWTQFETNGSYIAGNLGIGRSPAEKARLSVNGDIKLGGNADDYASASSENCGCCGVRRRYKPEADAICS